MQKSFILTLCKTPLRNIIQDQALLRILYFFNFFFFAYSMNMLAGKIIHIVSDISLPEFASPRQRLITYV